MNKKPIIIIDDDEDDLDFIRQAFLELKVENEILFFDDGNTFLDFVRATKHKAFFTLCDISMSKTNGLELKKKIFEDDELRMKCVPFIFLSSSLASASVAQAYKFDVQGYFIKPNNFEKLKEMLACIISYWDQAQVPNN